MAGKPQVLELLEEILDSGKTPEEACRDCPELLPEVRERWQQFCVIDAQIGALIPGLQTAPQLPRPTATPHVGSLPEIPGYEVEAVLGQGGVGVVYRARQRALPRFVAVKMLLAGPFAGPQELGRFRRETAALASLRHPNIVQVYDAGDVEGRPYFTMELIEGGSLTQKMAARPQPPRQAAELLTTLAEAVQAAHQAGIVHRDLKPANVLLSADGTPKISDFGLARRLEGDADLTQTGVPMGTPSYMAPEQAQAQTREVGPAVDIYALGAMLYELLTGRPPFCGANPLETLQQVIHQEPVPPARLNGKVPRDLDTICLKCLQKNPAHRYATAADLAADLGRFLRHEPIQARPISPVGRCVRWVRRRPAAAAMAATLVLVLLAGGVAAWFLHQEQTAAQVRQRLTEKEVLQTVGRARDLLEEGWQAHDLAKLKEAEAEARRAVQTARSSAVSATVQGDAETMLAEAVARRARAEKTRTLLENLLDVAVWQQTVAAELDEQGRTAVLAPQNLDEQYAAAYRTWGLDIDGTKEADVVARLRAEPDGVLQEVIARLDNWMLLRRREKRPEAQWRRLYRLADQLDSNERHRQLRALLAGEALPSADVAAGIVGAGQPWLALWEMARGRTWRQARALRKEIDARSAPVLTVALLSQAYLAVGDLDSAEEVLRLALTVRPGEVVLLYSMGRLCVQRGPLRLGQAIEYYRAARAQRPRMGLALSLALVHRGRADEAEDILNELHRDQSQNPEFYSCLGTALDAQKKHSAAEAVFRKAVNLWPKSAAMHHNLGVALARQGKPAAAEVAYRQAIDLQPEFALAYGNLGLALADQGKTGEAVTALRTAIGLEPKSANALYNLGTVLSEQRQFVDAEAAYRQAIELRPLDARAHVALGIALSQQSKVAAGEAAFRKASDLEPGNFTAYYNLGTNLYGQQKHAAAESAYRKALQRRPHSAPAHQGLALCLLQLAQFDEALECQRKSCELLPLTDPGRPKALALLRHCERCALLNARLPAILGGTEKPAGAAEQIELARLCTQKKLHAAAARFYAGAFTAQPKFAEQVQAGARFHAACVAALAGRGQGDDTNRLNDKERAYWRRRALEWLRQDLTWWAKALDHGKPQTSDDARQWLKGCLADEKLEGVRGHDSLQGLPEDERMEWEQFWYDVDALLRRLAAPE
jgi:serine/threonine-protein kinase